METRKGLLQVALKMAHLLQIRSRFHEYLNIKKTQFSIVIVAMLFLSACNNHSSTANDSSPTLTAAEIKSPQVEIDGAGNTAVISSETAIEGSQIESLQRGLDAVEPQSSIL